MRFYEGTLGDPSLVYPPNAVLEHTVQLDAPAASVRAVLRGFDVGFTQGDRDLVSISFDMETGYGDTNTQVVVRALARLAAPSGDWSPTRMLVHYTLIVQ